MRGRGDAAVDLGPAATGGSSGLAAFPGWMLWHSPLLSRRLCLTGMPRAGCWLRGPPLPAGVSSCAARCGHARREAVGGHAVALWSVHAVRDFNELPHGTICACLCSTGVVETACAATMGNTRRAFAVALGFFLGHVLLCGSCAA